jgi:AGCS family alanine or glycine:cation symporter
MFFEILSNLDKIFWGYIAFVMIIVLGVTLTVQSGFVQIARLPIILKTFWKFMFEKHAGKGIHPVKAFFASTGGMIGIGNVVGVATAVQCGGPGALFWFWVAGILGGILKYSEIYLGLKYRVENPNGGFDGGPMYYLRRAFNSKLLPIIVAGLLCIYGIEIYQFSVITDSVSTNWHCPRFLIIGLLLAAVLWAGVGGVSRISEICSWIIPIFIVFYLFMGLTILGMEIKAIPQLFATIFKSAFTGHAAVGGFLGSTMLLAVQHGISRASYSADICIGYDSIIQSESSVSNPQCQAGLAILGVFLDNLVCSITILIVTVSGAWKMSGEGSTIVQHALSQYFPYMNLFLPFFYLVVGYTTLIAYFCVGTKCCRYLFPRHGKLIYAFLGIFMFVYFSYVSQSKALLVMSVSGSMLLIINLLAIFKLRHEIQFIEPNVALNNNLV